MINFFNVYLVNPLFNFLIGIYNFLPWPDIGMAAIILTLLVRIIFYPLFHKSVKYQILTTRIQPELKKISEQYKDDKEKQVKAQMELYKKNKINPFGGCLATLIQLPIILALYRVFLNGFSPEKMANLYGFISKPENINAMFLGIVDLTKPNLIIAIISAGLQFWMSKKMMPANQPAFNANDKNNSAQKISGLMQKQMTYVAPIMTLFILIPLPSILGLYWSATTIFSMVQQIVTEKTIKIPEEKIEEKQ